jgi:hypothetical protein
MENFFSANFKVVSDLAAECRCGSRYRGGVYAAGRKAGKGVP